MEQETILKSKRTKVRNHLERTLPQDWRWNLTGNEFVRFEHISGPKTGVEFGCWFYTNLTHVRVHIDGNPNYGIADREEVLVGETAWSDCVEWITANISELDDIVAERLDRARFARAEYLRKLKGV